MLEVLPTDGHAKSHVGFILKSLDKLNESIPYLTEGINSGDPGADNGRFYFHLGDAYTRLHKPDEVISLQFYLMDFKHNFFLPNLDHIQDNWGFVACIFLQLHLSNKWFCFFKYFGNVKKITVACIADHILKDVLCDKGYHLFKWPK